MRKLKLELDALEVSTFEIDETAGGLGTVLGRGDKNLETKAACPPETGTCYNYDTCLDGCADTGTTGGTNTLTRVGCSDVSFCVVC